MFAFAPASSSRTFRQQAATGKDPVAYPGLRCGLRTIVSYFTTVRFVFKVSSLSARFALLFNP